MSGLYINLEINLESEEYLIETNVKKDKIDEFLSEYYRASMSKGPDKSNPNDQSKYHIKIKLDLEEDIFTMKSDTGNKVLAYELIIEAIGNWKFKSNLELKVNKANLSS